MLNITNNAGSLGDYLALTPLMNAVDCEVEIFENSRSKELASVYNGLAKVKFVDKPVAPINELNINVCFSKRILEYYNFSNYSPIPNIRLTPEEKAWAADYLSKYEKPIAFNNTVANPNTGHPLAKYRELPNEFAKLVIEKYNENGNTVLQFGLSKNYTHFSNTIPILDLSIRQMASCFYIIKKYIGSDTGDYHLMLSVGGESHVFVPQSEWHYDHKKHLYFDYAWVNEPIKRVFYYPI